MKKETEGVVNFVALKEQLPLILSKQANTLAKARTQIAAFPEVTNNEQREKGFEIIEKLKLASKTYYEQRIPFTRMLDSIKKQFTANEAGFTELVLSLQKKLDSFAAKQLAISRSKEKEQEIIAKNASLDIIARAAMESSVEKYVSDAVDIIRKTVEVDCKTVTPSTLFSVSNKYEGEATWPDQRTQALQVLLKCNDPKMSADTKAYANKLILEAANKYVIEATEAKAAAVKALELASTNKEEAAKLLEEEKKEAAARSKESLENIKASSEANQAISQLTVGVTEKPSVKTTYSIEITNNLGWMKVIAFWFGKDPEAKTGSLDKKTFLQCKSFAEKWAKDYEEFIEDPNISYKEVVKAKK